MASAHSLSLAALHTRTLPQTCKYGNARTGISASSDRRQFIILTTGVAATLAARRLTAKAEDIGFFGTRTKVKEVQTTTEEKGTVEAEGKEGEAAEKRKETAQEEISKSDSFGAVVQAGAVAGAEFVGVLVATSVVKRIIES